MTTFDHDWPSLATGVAIAPGLYDLKRNHGFVTLGTSHDTSEFACDSLRWWWQTYGRHDYPDATSLLLRCDGGGSNRSNTFLFKLDLARFAQETGLTVRVAHYPPYTSKDKPIEQRLFPHLTRACQGVICTRLELVQELLAKASTRTGRRVTVNILKKVYQTGRQVAAAVKEQIRLVRDEALANWNYLILSSQPELGRVIY